jgi:putative flippase GtrA
LKISRKFVLFVAVGGFATLVNFVARIIINHYTSFGVAIVLAFPIALATAFVLHRLYVFEPVANLPWQHQFVRFLIVNLVALAQVFLVSMVLANLVFPAIGMRFHPDTVAHGIGLISQIFTSFYAHKRFSFGGGATRSDSVD